VDEELEELELIKNIRWEEKEGSCKRQQQSTDEPSLILIETN
jgi:hypothetical protein